MSQKRGRKVNRQQVKLKMNISAVANGGKTMSSLLIAFGLCDDWSKIWIIDSENGSADLYEHLGPYNVIPISPPFTPENYIDALHEAIGDGAQVVIIDSISHEWEGAGGILQMADEMGGQFQSAWKALTPRHEAFKNAILQAPVHIITTTRRKQEYVLQEDINRHGNKIQKPVKVGLKEITREGWEYEVTINMHLGLDHYADISKDRTQLFRGAPFMPTVETGQKIRKWCENGASPMDAPKWSPSATNAPTVAQANGRRGWPPHVRAYTGDLTASKALDGAIMLCETTRELKALYDLNRDTIAKYPKLSERFTARKEAILAPPPTSKEESDFEKAIKELAEKNNKPERKEAGSKTIPIDNLNDFKEEMNQCGSLQELQAFYLANDDAFSEYWQLHNLYVDFYEKLMQLP